MRLLLDSHIAFWAMGFPEKLSSGARRALESAESELFLSAASIWELRLKASKGKLSLPEEFEESLTSENILELPVAWRHAKLAASLLPIHQDPFDRILVAQASLEDMTLVTQDPDIQQYPIATLR